jgi:hemolysin activation/secretion protein
MSKHCCTKFTQIHAVLILLFVLTGHALANNASELNEKLIKQGITRIENQVAPLLNKQDVFLGADNEDKGIKTVDTEEERCFDIEHIAIEGVSVFSAAEITDISQAYEGRCIGLISINQLVAQLSDLYMQHGYITSRAYIKPQDLSQGQLTIIVLEGYVQSIVAANNDLTNSQLELSFPTGNGETLNLRDLEQGLENLNRLGQNQATTALSPGDFQGSSVVVVNNNLFPDWRGSLSVSNTGVEETGLYQLDGNFIYDNLFGLNDSIITSFSSNIGEHELPESQSRSYSMIGNVPYGYWYFSINGTYFEYGQTVLGNVVDFLTHGTSLNTSVKVEHMLYRGARDKLNLAGAFIRKESKNYIEDVFLETSSRTLYIWQLSADYTRYFLFGSFNGRAQIDQSVPWLDASTNLVDAEQDFQFTKYQLDLTFASSFELFTQFIQYSSTLHLLSSPKEILTSEGLSIGGRYSVRGISRNSLFGYHGGYLRNDVNFPLQASWLGSTSLGLFIGLDAGISDMPDYPDLNSEWMTGSIVGIRGAYRGVNFTASYAKALRVPDMFNAQDNVFDFTLGISF